MGIFSGQLANIVEWTEYRDDVIFWKWHNAELKRDSRLIIRPGQDAVFMYNGRIEGVFRDEGNFEINSDIIPFLSTLKGYRFGFKSGLRAEVLYVNTREFTIKWGTNGPINIPAENLPGGLPIRCYGTCVVKASDYVAMIDQIAGVRDIYRVEDLEQRITSVLNQYLISAIVREGKDMFNLQANSQSICEAVRTDLDMELHKIGMSVVGFYIQNFSYPKEIQDRIDDVASTAMVGDIQQYQQVHMIDSMTEGGGNTSAGAFASDMVGMMAGMQMAGQMMNQAGQVFNQNANNDVQEGGKFCPNCGAKVAADAAFCSKCGAKLS